MIEGRPDMAPDGVTEAADLSLDEIVLAPADAEAAALGEPTLETLDGDTGGKDPDALGTGPSWLESATAEQVAAAQHRVDTGAQLDEPAPAWVQDLATQIPDSSV